MDWLLVVSLVALILVVLSLAARVAALEREVKRLNDEICLLWNARERDGTSIGHKQ